MTCARLAGKTTGMCLCAFVTRAHTYIASATCAFLACLHATCLPKRFVIILGVIPRFLRLRQDKGGGAWCPRNMVTKEGKEYLEVNLHSPRLLTSTKTQGRFGNGHGVEYTEEYFVEYWRPGFNKWVRWRNRHGMEVGTIWPGHRSNHARDFFPGDRKPELTARLQIFSEFLY